MTKDKCRSAPCVAQFFGAVFIAVAVLGFIPNPIVSENGIFMVNTAHNVLHALVGVLLLVSAKMNYAKNALMVFGIVYVLIGILGYMGTTDMLFGMVMVNMADHYLHLLLGVVLIAAGIYVKPQKA